MGTWPQAYDNGHQDSTTANCSSMTYRANGITLTGGDYLIPANSGSTGTYNGRGAQNKDVRYSASAGWYWRPWDRLAAWEFFKIESDGTLVVRHFCTDSSDCQLTSPEGSSNYCCSSTSKVAAQTTCQAAGTGKLSM